MSKDGDDGFLTRWSRRKAEAQRREEEPPVPAAPPAGAVAEEETFDISTLPSIESLTADSDLSVFMRKGVPAALRDAAISRMWVSDPNIRDYIGLSEMSWDFNAAEAFPGYGALSPDTDIASMVTDIFEGQKAPAAPQPEMTQQAVAESEPAGEIDAASTAGEAAGEIDQAEAEDETPERPAPAQRRRHGGATPI